MFLDAASDEEEDEGGYLGADRRGLGGEGEDEEYDSDAEVYNAGAEAAEKVGWGGGYRGMICWSPFHNQLINDGPWW